MSLELESGRLKKFLADGHLDNEGPKMIALKKGYPAAVHSDRRPEFRGLAALDEWNYQWGVTLKLIRAGRHTQNALIEAFNGNLRVRA